MTTFSVPQISYINYELTTADEFVLSLLLNLHPAWAVCSRHDSEQRSQKVATIKWWRERFGCGLKEAKDAVEYYCEKITSE